MRVTRGTVNQCVKRLEDELNIGIQQAVGVIARCLQQATGG